MLNIKDLHNIYFLGIGGIGMSALARYFKGYGCNVSGYDKTKTILTQSLEHEGIPVHYHDRVEEIPEKIDLVIYTPAVPKNLSEFLHLAKTDIPIKKRSEVLGWITSGKKTIAVAGTHGKTTVSTLIGYMLKNSAIDCSAFLGGISKNFNTNFLNSANSDWMVVEADEFDRSFLHLKPEIGIITSMDADHLDIYGTYETMISNYTQFANQVKHNGKLLLKKGLEKKFDHLQDAQILTYALTDKSDFYASNIRLENKKYRFDLICQDTIIRDLTLGVPGLINVENSVAAAAVALIAGVNEQEIKTALPAFSGIQRRFDVQIQTEKMVFIDDYAHHPEEIRGFVKSVKNIFPGKKILGIFQPHLYSRTRDFATGFAASLELLDEVIILPIYPAREEPIEGVSSKMIYDKINMAHKFLCTKTEIFNKLEESTFDIILTMGAGDIDQLVLPVKNFLLASK